MMKVSFEQLNPTNSTALEFLEEAQDSINAKLETIRTTLQAGNLPEVARAMRELETEVRTLAHPTDGFLSLV